MGPVTSSHMFWNLWLFGIYGQLPTTEVRLGNCLITNKGAIGTGSLMSERPNFLTRSKGNKLT